MKAGHAKRKRALAQKGAATVAGKVARQRARTKPAPAARKSAWASLSPEQRAERIERMRAGRTAKPAQPAAPTAR